jgi:putative membrane protein
MFLVHHGMFLGPLFLFGQFFWFVLLALLIAMLVRLFSRRRAWHYNRPPFYTPSGRGAAWPGMPPVPPVQPSAMEILRQRYARGEIDATTFDQMRERLEASGKPEQQ